MKRTLILNILFLYTITLLGQVPTSKIKGKLIDSKSKEGLVGVNITVENTTNGATTDENGNYEIDIASGDYTLIFSYIGYDDIKKKITLKNNQTQTVDIEMGEIPMLMDEIVVTSSKFERKISEETVSIDVIKPAALEKQNINNVSDVLQRSPGVSVVDGQVNIRGGSGWSYGAGTRVLLLLDDLPILQADAGFPSFSGLPVENLGQVEIIKGAASALYGSSAMNGIINLRTAYPTSKPYFKLSVFGSVVDNPNQNNRIGIIDSLGNFTGEFSNVKTNKNWWELDSITLKGASVAGIINSPDTTISNQFQKRPYETGFSFAYRDKLMKDKKFELVMGGMLLKSQSHRWGTYETRGRITINTRYRINEKWSTGVNLNIQAAKSGTFFLWGGNGIDKYIPSALTGIPTESRSFRMSIDPYARYVDSKGNSHKILTRYIRTDIQNTNNQSNSNDYYYAEYQYQRKITKWNFVVTGGAVASYVKSVSQLFGDTTNIGSNIAGYFQLDKKFWKRLNISYGFRFESNQIKGQKRETKPVSRAGISIEAAKYTFIRASFGQGYRFPTIAERYTETQLGSSFGIIPNPDLTSETGFSAEVGIKQGIKFGRKFNAFIDVAAFYTQFSNMIEFGLDFGIINNKPGLGFKASNIENTRIFGTEINLAGEGKLFNKFPSTLVVGYTFILPQYRKYDEAFFDADIVNYNLLKYRFRHQLQGAWDISFDRFDLGATIQYFSALENFDGIFGKVLPSLLEYKYGRYKSNWQNKKPQYQAKGDFILDLRAAYNFGKEKNFKFSFVVKNVTNREYTLRPSLVESPRNFGFRFDATFN